MADYINATTVTITERQRLISSFPCFAGLSPEQSAELASLMHEVNFAPQTVIIKENELVDSIFIVVAGIAEVSRAIKKRKKVIQVPVAALSVGEGVGLNDTGFYSSTGKRTATVTAITELLLLRLDINDLYHFLKQNNLESSMYAASKQMQRMRFIKQSLPFAKLSHERLQWLADRVEEVSVPAGTIIFNQGDMGDTCYMIRSGKVEIVSKNEDGEKHRLALLNPPVLFGEATLITHTPRNATALAFEDCELFVLSHNHLSELIESEDNVANMFMTLMVDRSRPQQNPHVTKHSRMTADGNEITILKNLENGNYFKLSKEGAFVWQQLDGNHTLQEITLDLAQKFNVFAPDVVAALISKLTRAGYISNLELNQVGAEKRPLWLKMLGKVRRGLEFRYAFGDSDSFITKTYNKYIHIFFSKAGQVFLAILAITGIISFAIQTPNVLLFFSFKHISLLLLLTLIPFSWIVAILHELGHAYAVKAFGREVHYIGIGWYLFSPIAFTDTSDMWLSTRRPRMLVNLAGVYVDVLVAGLSALLIWLIPNPYVQGMLWLFALYTYIGGFRMLSPLQELDGYYILMDWVEKNRLRQSAVVWLVKKFPKALKNPTLFRENKPEIAYWVAVIVYLIFVTVITLMIQTFVFAVLGITSQSIYFSLILPFLVLIFSSFSIIVDIRNKAEE